DARREVELERARRLARDRHHRREIDVAFAEVAARAVEDGLVGEGRPAREPVGGAGEAEVAHLVARLAAEEEAPRAVDGAPRARRRQTVPGEVAERRLQDRLR